MQSLDRLPDAYPRLLRFCLLSLSSFGLQILWSVLMSCGTPFLISLGIKGSVNALVWSIAPLCGTIVQPLFGKLSDVRQRQGNGRGSFLIGGAIASSLALIGFSQSKSQSLLLINYLDWAPSTVEVSTKVIATAWFFMLNVAIQPLQMASRAIVIENNDTASQIAANIWAGRMQGLGSIFGFLIASRLADRFLILSILTSVLMVVTAVFSTLAINPQAAALKSSNGHDSELAKVDVRRKHIPRELRQIFIVQFFSWLGWFPFRTYYTR